MSRKRLVKTPLRCLCRIREEYSQISVYFVDYDNEGHEYDYYASSFATLQDAERFVVASEKLEVPRKSILAYINECGAMVPFERIAKTIRPLSDDVALLCLNHYWFIRMGIAFGLNQIGKEAAKRVLV